MILRFPLERVHRRDSAVSRAARRVKRSGVSPSDRATGVERIDDHHSAGIESRCHHLLTCEPLAPMIDAIASLEAHRSMIARNEESFAIAARLGQFVLIGKRFLSCDCANGGGHNVLVPKAQTRKELRQQFAQRVKAARERSGLSQTQVAMALGIKQDRYKHYEVDRYLPHEFIEPFCIACGVDPDYFYPKGRRVRPAA